MISFKDVSFKYPGAENWVLNDISVDIEPGEFVGIIGGNGAGKSTFCKAMNGLIPFYYVGDLEGDITINGIRTIDSNVGQLSKHVAYVYQDFENQLVRPTVYDEVIFSPLNYGYPDYKERGMEALEILGLTSIANEYIWQLSGGQKHLVALAGALSLNPDIMIIDEPVAQLDPAHAISLYEKLKMLNEQYNKTIIVIEHHTEFVASYCKQVILLEDGTIKWKKPVDEALNRVEELSERDIFPPQVTVAAHSLLGSTGALPVTVKQAKELLQPYVTQSGFSRMKKMQPVYPRGEALVELKDVKYGYKSLTRKRKEVLDGVSLKLYENERIALVGSNGAGKSTLLKLISGIIKPYRGNVITDGMLTKKTSPEKIAERVALIYQKPEEMFIQDSIKKDVSHFLDTRKVEGRSDFINDVMETFNLTELAERDGRLLSGGQQRRTSLAIGMAMTPLIMLMDEPTSSLDMATRKEMMKLLGNLDEGIKTAVVATHDMQLVAEWATRVIVMHEGNVLADLPPHLLFEDQALLQKASLVEPQIVTLCHELGVSPVSLSIQDFVEKVFPCMERGEKSEWIS
ncbi:energy-coupling factor transporter ATPase [Alkalicoccobacillus gibsonii]|uniref:Energy-coupling factor transporter ATPase n=1 Tax=Alkalicoccobacillus gibsonii TaxID=79881 RepID=A0ABU9VMM6_9BACI